VYKDLSVVVDAQLPYRTLDQAIASSPPPLLRRWYPVDVYRDAALAEGKSVTIRLLVQSDKGTLSDKEIDATVSAVLERVEVQCQAHLR
jgi:phenylalanyl-tRNA synthetase beta chain